MKFRGGRLAGLLLLMGGFFLAAGASPLPDAVKAQDVSQATLKRIPSPKYRSFGEMMVALRKQAQQQKGPDVKNPAVLAAVDVLKTRPTKLRSSHDVRNLGNLLDATDKNRWSSGKQMPGMWVSLEFSEPIYVESLVLDAGRSKGDYPQGYEVYFSNDGRRWGQPVAEGAGRSAVTTIEGLGKTTRFVKIMQTSDQGRNWSLHDVRVNGISLSYGKYDSSEMWSCFPRQMAWLTQDAVNDREAARLDSLYDVNADLFEFITQPSGSAYLRKVLTNVLSDLGAEGAAFKAQFDSAVQDDSDASYLRSFKLYESACMARRKIRLQPLLAQTDQIIFAKRPVYDGIFYINETKGTADLSELCSIDLTPEADGKPAVVSTFVDSEGGMMRDPELSFDAKKLLFAWRRSTQRVNSRDWAPDTGNYQIYELDLETSAIRQLTTDETYGANKEPLYLPNGDILFNSQRIVQHITCGWGDCSNFYLMNRDGKYQRRIGFDQTNTIDPVVLHDGRIIYLRRDYNDRGQSSAHALFQMRPDGTSQTEYYGNQTGTPNSIQQPATIPGSKKVAVILGGYHNNEGGQLAILDVSNGRQNDEGLVRIPQGDKPPTEPGHDDDYAKDGIQYHCPRPISETEFVVCRSDLWGKKEEKYSIYFMTADGARELLASDPNTSCLDPVPVIARAVPPQRPSLVDYTQETGTFYLQNTYIGAAAEGIEPKSIKRLRVVEILYKHDTVEAGIGSGPGGGNHTVTPTGCGLASFDSKRIIGSATVYPDGSAMFEAPARVPLYFQLLDDENRVVQTMRSWTTLMPGERFSCVGCHENKNETPAVSGQRTIASEKGVEQLEPFYGPPRAFSYLAEVQPVFDKNCIKCHKQGGKADHLLLTAEPFVEDPMAGRRWAQSYFRLAAARPRNPEEYNMQSSLPEWTRKGAALPDEPNRYVNYWTRFELMGPQVPYRAGSITSGMIKKLEDGHVKRLSNEAFDKLKAWIDLNLVYAGEYTESNIWDEEHRNNYQAKIDERKRNEAIEAKAIAEFIQSGQ